MKIYIWTLLLVSLCFTTYAQDQPNGAWQLETDDGTTKILLLSGDYFTWTEHATETGAFHMTKGGKWKQEGKKMMLELEFHTQDTAQVGKSESISFKYKPSSGQLKLKKQGKWTALEAEEQTALTSPYLFAGRKRNGEIQMRDTDQPRKTMKILTGTRFQWIAYNTATKQFFGTGGGTYTAKDGKYVEQITFFSRDNSRVGASLEFDYEVIDGNWHHSGLSSKGKPIYEIWAVRE
ncbi:MAG: membrane or secreted protein [Bacteroidota bacterium]